MSKLFLWGAGGHAKVVLDIARALNRFSGVEFIDENAGRAGEEFCGCRVLGSPEIACIGDGDFLVISIGSNQARARCAGIARSRGWQLATLIHPSAVVSPSARIGAGTVVMPRAVVNAGAEIGENSIINTGALVEHDCRIGDHVHLSPGAILGGAVRVESFAHMGLGSIALPGSSIGGNAVVGAGAVVLRSVGHSQTVVGVPARPIRQQNRPGSCATGASR
jgi:sugar O-acyltransferase (sialic acid O-acetyltransferase NeuD family)